MHATVFLEAPERHGKRPVVVMFGQERYLKQEAVRALMHVVLGDEDELGLTRFPGKEIDLAAVCDELETVSMWGDRRLVVVEDADPFITRYRGGLERYAQNPSTTSVLVLDVKSWPKNTRLAKIVAKTGLDLECAPLSGRPLVRWLIETCGQRYERRLASAAATLLVELAGADMGLLDQELAKLASYVGDRQEIGADDVHTLVGGWKAETTWTMVAAIRDGNPAVALACLDKLLIAGEAPQKVLGGIQFVFRKLAMATEMARMGRPLGSALSEAGVFPRDISPSDRYLRRIGRPHAENLSHLLSSADSDLKGGSRAVPRLLLEQLVVRLCGT